MSLQFNAEGINGPLVSLSYRSSDEDMEIDSIYSAHDTAPQDSDDDDIRVIACYSENREVPPQLAAGRAMTSDLSACLGYLSLPETTETATESYFTEPSEDLIEWFVGSPPSTYAGLQPQQHPRSQCSQVDPVSYSPMSRHWSTNSPTTHRETTNVRPKRNRNGLGTNTLLVWASVLADYADNLMTCSTVVTLSAGNHFRR